MSIVQLVRLSNMVLQGIKLLFQKKSGKPRFELINFTEREAREFFNEISNGAGVKAELVIR